MKDKNGFTLIECTITICMFSIGIIAIASTTTAIMKGTQHISRVAEATAMAQDLITDLRNRDFIIGPDGLIGSGDFNDKIDDRLSNDTKNDKIKISAALFANPDHAYGLNDNGKENLSKIMTAPDLSKSLSPKLRRTWSILDDVPLKGVKFITVVVGWVEGGQDHYLTVKTIIAGKRYEDTTGS